VLWLAVAALAGFGFSAASAWVHYRILHDPLYSSFCDVSATFSCTEAYTSRYGSIAGVPVALLGALYFALLLIVIGLCRRSESARANLASYVFVLSTAGLAVVLYLAYASFAVLGAVCLLCVGTYVATIALFVLSGKAATSMHALPSRAARDLRGLVRTPAALAVVAAFVFAAAIALASFRDAPATGDASAAGAAEEASDSSPEAARAAPSAVPPAAIRELEQYLAAQPRTSVPGAGGSGAAVVIVKFNDYQCPPCGLTYREYGPVLERLHREHPGEIAFITKDFPLDPQCNPLGGGHEAGCEAAVAVRLAREKGRAEAMEAWLFANQPTLTPQRVKEGLAEVAGIPPAQFDARFADVLELVRRDIAQGLDLGVQGTPTFFMNGLRLPNLRGEYFEAAVEWELRRAGVVRGDTSGQQSRRRAPVAATASRAPDRGGARSGG
jgi:uncharacterized membrane protein/predicted DsbA family dithiol-disulfide isomerase